MDDQPSQLNEPTSQAERIDSLDVLRGFALLGILMVNIQSFAMVDSTYANPSSFGDWTGTNFWAWWQTHVFFDSKMMTIFSILFGAGIVLMADRALRKSGKVVGLHLRRMAWLLLIGLLHAYLIWPGDILYTYALCGVVVFWLRNLPATILLIIGLLLVGVPVVLFFGFDVLLSMAPKEVHADMQAEWSPPPEVIQEELATYRGSWLTQMPHRIFVSLMMQTFVFGILFFWRAAGLMLMGMAFYKWGILSAQRSNRFYAIGAFIGLCFGIPVILLGVQQNFAAGWSWDYSMFIGVQFNYCASLLVSFAYICLIMLWCKSDWLPGLQRPFQAVGQMALTNYLMQSIICTLLFYGHGLGWFGYRSRTELVGIVVAIWILQLIWSPIWLSRFRYGPFEWAWRSLAYWRRQPMRRKDQSLPGPANSSIPAS